ncbi:hypothetical protein PIROE2DRAFT_57565 [Piromyces sp. E2]|nr:hypothetical protein PIROE2DRAFT_57565 [Piromyces sp. E2]|eukprot:OUM69194.1 hypothetical protein PIROE2DRAFT_57565 [Piromyces sp. E2]
MDIETSSISSDNKIKRISSSDKSLTQTYILTSSDTDTTSNSKSAIIYDIKKSVNNKNDDKEHKNINDGSDDEPLNAYIRNNRRSKQGKQEKDRRSSTTPKRKDNINNTENIKKRQKLNINSDHYSDNDNKELLVIKNSKENNENVMYNNNINEMMIETKRTNNRNKERLNDVDVKKDEVYRYNDEERDEKFLYDLCARINCKKEYWNDKFHYIKGTTVWALWEDLEDNFYYVGKIVNFTKKYRIKFFDGDYTDVNKDKLRPFNVNLGDIVCVSLKNDTEYSEEDGINGLRIVQIKSKISGNKNHDTKYKAMILKKKLDEINNTYSLEKTDKTITVMRKNFVLPEKFLKIMDKQKKDIENKNLIETNIPNSNIKIEIPLKESKIVLFDIKGWKNKK